MPTLEIGQSFTTQQSKVTGVVQEVVKNANGSLRVRLVLPNGQERWTTAKQSSKIKLNNLGSSREKTTTLLKEKEKQMAVADRLISDMQSKLMTSGYYNSQEALIEVAKQALKKLSPQKVQELFNVDVPYEIAIRDFVSTAK